MVQLTKRADSSGFNVQAVSSDVLFGTVWSLTILSFLFLPARLYARLRATKRLFWDDFLVTFAWILSLAIAITLTVYYPVTVEIMLIGAGLKKFPPNVKIITMQFTRVFTVIPMLFYAGLWCIKLAFLLFFRRLGLRNVTSLRRWWRIVLVVTIVSLLVCYSLLPYRCTLVSFQIVASAECQTQGLSFVAMGVNTAMDVMTDCLIMSIPFMIIRRIRISRHQRLVLSAVFSLVIVTIIFAVVRATVTTIGVKRQIDPLWMYLWTSIELNIAIIIACVAPYRSLFIRNRTPVQEPYRHSNIKERARKFWSSHCSSSRSSGRQEREENWSTMELPYLAPWVETENPVQDGAGPNHKAQSNDLTQVSPTRGPPTRASMPYLAPWDGQEDDAIGHAEESSEVLLTLPQAAYVAK
ncbi:hypothetical protein OPT61_g4094 [Boeremia exigua]|uniref:Uncharacterized protein n=1 Tax=Boeremia exigua TaxID=749465 RepID=A0ACC2IFG3_9PLEO|nr:hypothetical protein OPT61_g4094 [Boeremia exigua]